MRRLIYSMLFSAALAAGGVGAVQAQVVEQSGRVFHVAVCPGPAAPGTARCHAHVVTDRGGNPIADAFSNGTPSGYGPADLRSAYNVVQTINPATVPTGPIVAIVDAYGYPNAERDLGIYRSQFGLPACTSANGCFIKVNQNGAQGGYPQSNTGWDQEQALDVDMVSAICPTCRILLVEASSPSYANLATAVTTAANLGAHAISNSYGGGESGSQSYESFYNQQARGVAVTASSGDSGYSAGPEFPATSPHVTAVGGTSLYHTQSGARAWTETVWSGAGSGCSKVYPKPSWQLDTLCVANLGVGGRMEADVSAVADPNTGVAVYGPAFGKFSGWLVFGGTSVASPLTAAIYGLKNDSKTFVSSLYPGAGASPGPYAASPSLNVVTSGSNGSCGGSYLCTASGSWNYNGPAGLGTPNGSGGF